MVPWLWDQSKITAARHKEERITSLKRILEESLSLVGGRERFVSKDRGEDSGCLMKALYLRVKGKEKMGFISHPLSLMP